MGLLRRALIPLALLCVAGCHRGWSVDVTVVDDKGAPIPEATARFRCGPALVATGPIGNFITKDDGKLHVAGSLDTDPGPDCSYDVVASGHKTATFAVRDACYRSSAKGNFGEPCAEAKAVVP